MTHTSHDSRREHQQRKRRNRRRRAAQVHTLFDPPSTLPGRDWPAWRTGLNTVIFGADTRTGQVFDWALLLLIAASVVVVLLDSVGGIRATWGEELRALEWLLTVVFTLEYVVRLLVVKRPLGYATSFFGVVDLVSVLPTWLSLVMEGSEVLAVIRVLRMLRVFRLMQLSQFAHESEALASALVASASRITVFLGSVLTIVVIMGSVMYLVEGQASGFDSIPRGIYWAIVTMTTVGYGDIAPRTALGQAIAAAVMILGYAIIAVPTGIVSAEIATGSWREEAEDPGDLRGADPTDRASCRRCDAAGHAEDASFCRVCGEALPTRD